MKVIETVKSHNPFAGTEEVKWVSDGDELTVVSAVAQILAIRRDVERSQFSPETVSITITF